MKIIVLNGPPGCGKDTIATHIQNRLFDAEVVTFKDPMFNVAIAMLPMSEADFFERYNDRELKELPWDALGGLTCRQFMIKISEEWMKPLLGKDIFGRLAVSAVEKLGYGGTTLCIFSDSGFQEEFTFLQDAFGKENVHLIRLEREGFDFTGDSRNYIAAEGSPFTNISLIEDYPRLASLQIMEAIR